MTTGLYKGGGWVNTGEEMSTALYSLITNY